MKRLLAGGRGTKLFGRVLALTGLMACAEQPGSVDRVALRVYGVAFDSVDQDPYQGVEFVRVTVTDGPATLQDEFFTFDKAQPRVVPQVDFGEGLQVAVEGWSRNTATNSVGTVLSRGKSVKFDMDAEGDKVTLTLPLARTNTFSYTTQAGTSQSVATGLNRGRLGHTVTLLSRGKVLITGGLEPKTKGDFTNASQVSALYSDAEIYDAATGAFSPVGSLKTARAFHSATALPDGRVLIAGGLVGASEGGKTVLTVSKTLEIFDPVAGSFTALAGIEMKDGRAGHTGTRLDANGNVLLAGGFRLDAAGGIDAIATGAVLCAPDHACAGSKGAGFIFEDTMNESRAFHTAELLTVGKGDLAREAVVIIGGEGTTEVRDTIEIFYLKQPAGFLKGSQPKMVGGGRTRHTATYVDRQKYVHVVGGFSDKAHAKTVPQIDSFDVALLAFQDKQQFFSVEGRGGHGAVLMDRNTVLTFGGWGDDGTALATAEVIFEQSGNDGTTFINRAAVGPMRFARGGAIGAFTENGTAVIVGGSAPDGSLVKAGEFFTPL